MCTWLKGSIPCQVAEVNVTASMPRWGQRGAGGTASLAPWPLAGAGPLASRGCLVASSVSWDNGVATPEPLCAFCPLISALSQPKKGPLLAWCSDEKFL